MNDKKPNKLAKFIKEHPTETISAVASVAASVTIVFLYKRDADKRQAAYVNHLIETSVRFADMNDRAIDLIAKKLNP